MVEILAKLTSRNALGQTAVRRRKDPNPNRPWTNFAQSGDGTLL
jgi:hypothetical protein